MADYDGMTPGEILADTSVADFISSLGLGIAEAQRELDRNAIEQLDAYSAPVPGLGDRSLIGLGFVPAFYHYQHADLSCSLQLSLRVQKEVGVDFGIEANFGRRDSSDASRESERETSSAGSSTRALTRRAELEVANTATGSVTIGGRDYPMEGETARERVDRLAERLRGSEDVDRVVIDERPSAVNPTTDAPPELLQTSPNAVAFISQRTPVALIRVSENVRTAYRLNDASTVDQAPGADIAETAADLEQAIAAEGFSTWLTPPGACYMQDPLLFDHDSDQPQAASYELLLVWASLVKVGGIQVTLEGHTDTSGTTSYNQDLSRRRAETVRSFMVRYGAPEDSIAIEALGETDPAVATGDGVRRQENRRVEMRLSETAAFVTVQDDTAALASPTPDLTAGGSGNGVVALSGDPEDPAELSGHSVTVLGETFALRGGAASGLPADSSEAFAANFADDVNAADGLGVDADRLGPVVMLRRASDSMQLTLLTSSSREMAIDSREGITVTRQFEHHERERETRRRQGNRAVAVGASLGVRFARQFEMQATGNSSISARLVSVPPPEAFVELIRRQDRGE